MVHGAVNNQGCVPAVWDRRSYKLREDPCSVLLLIV